MSEQLTPYTKERYSEDTMPESGESKSWDVGLLEREESDDERDSTSQPKRNRPLTIEERRMERVAQKYARRLGRNSESPRKKEWDEAEYLKEQARREESLGPIPQELREAFSFFDKETFLNFVEGVQKWGYDPFEMDYEDGGDGPDNQDILKMLNDLTTELIDAGDIESVRQLISSSGTFKNVFDEIQKRLDPNSEYNEGRKGTQRMQKNVGTANQRNEEFKRRIRSINEALVKNNRNEAKDQAFRLTEYLKEIRSGMEQQKIDVRSIEDLAELIIETDRELWGEKFPLLDSKGQVNQANFLTWVRERMLWHDGNDSDNPLQLFSLIELTTPYRGYNLNGMLSQKGKFFRTRDGVDLSELHEAVTREVWLFQASRNDDLKYKLKMSSDTDLTNQIKEMFYVNTFTKNAFGKSTMRWIMTMPEKFRPSYAQRTVLEQEEGQADTNVGEAIRTAFLIYYHIADFERLEEILGKDSPLMSKSSYVEHIIRQEGEAVKEQFKALGKNVMGLKELNAKGMDPNTEYMTKRKEREDTVRELLKNNQNSKESVAIQARWLGTHENGSPYTLSELFYRDGSINRTNFIDFVNFFKGPETTLQTISTVRSMIRQSIDELYPERVDDKTAQSTRGEDFDVPHYAERWAHSMLRWTGAAARNDTGARAYDKWTELQLLREKRHRDSAEKRISAFGNPYNFNLYKALAPDLLTGLVIQQDKKTSPYQLLWELEKKRIKKSKTGRVEDIYDVHDLLQGLEFTDNAMGQFAAVQIANAVQLLEAITGAKELNFDKMASIDKYGRLVFNEADVQEELKSFFKNFRNAYSTWSQINFDTQVRALVDNQTDPPTYKTKSLAEVMFGDEILDIEKFHDKSGKFSSEIMMKTRNYRDILWKQLAKGYIAAQIRAHRDIHSNYSQYDYHQLHIIYETLEKIPGEILFLTKNETDLRNKTKEALEAREKAEKALINGNDEEYRKYLAEAQELAEEVQKARDEEYEKEINQEKRIEREQKKSKFRKEFEKRFKFRLYNSPERTIMEIRTAGAAFSHEDIKWIREHSGTEEWKVNWGDHTGTFFAAGWEAIKGLFGVVSNSVKD